MGNTQIGNESFAMIVFAAQWPENPELRPRKTHTFATFIHGKPDGTMDTHTISWLPYSGCIDLLLQVGVNYSLPRTIEWAVRGGMDVLAWHAFEIKEKLFESALQRICDLESGHFGYYFLGMGGRAINCTHALSDLNILPSLGVTIRSGVDAK